MGWDVHQLFLAFFVSFLAFFCYRYVCWSAHLIKRHPKLASKLGKLVDEDDPDGLGCAPALPDYTAKLCMDQKLYFQYFVQDDVEDGTLMDTKIPINEVGVKGQLISKQNSRAITSPTKQTLDFYF